MPIVHIMDKLDLGIYLLIVGRTVKYTVINAILNHFQTIFKPFSVRKGTMFFGLRTPMDKIINVLGLLASGVGVNAMCREQDVTADSLRSWIVLAANQVTAFTEYMQQNRHLEQVQIDEFWSFIRKKRELDRK